MGRGKLGGDIVDILSYVLGKKYADKLTGTLANLSTTAKNNIVVAVNEIFGKVEDVEDSLAAHKADGAHQKVLATSTDDATSVTNAPLKSAGGLAVAKKAYIGDTIVARSGGIYLRVGQYSSFNVTWNDLGPLENGKQLRVRFQATAGNQTIAHLRFVGGEAGSTVGRNAVMDKTISFKMAYNDTLIDLVSSVCLADKLVDNEVFFQAVGENAQVDLIIKHPAAHTYALSRWALTCDLVGIGSPLAVVDMQIEDIPS